MQIAKHRLAVRFGHFRGVEGGGVGLRGFVGQSGVCLSRCWASVLGLDALNRNAVTVCFFSLARLGGSSDLQG